MTHKKVQDVMTRDVVTVRLDTPYRQIVDLLAERKVSALPVLDDAGQVVGIVSEADLLHKIEFADRDGQTRLFESGRTRSARAKAASSTAEDLMSAPAYVINPEASIVAAAKVMDTEAVKRLPVVTETGKLVGIVSRPDLLGVFLRPDSDIAREVETEVVHRILWATPEQVRVRVTDGVVTLTGKLERRSLLPLAERLTRAVDGVVDVEMSGLGYDMDDSDIRRPPRFAEAWGPSNH